MRALGVLALLVVAGCGDDDSGPGGGADMHAPAGDGGAPDLAAAAGDMACTFGSFSGFFGDNSVFHSFDCTCGCNVDRFDNDALNGMWGASHSPGSSFAAVQYVGLGVALAWMPSLPSGGVAYGGLASGGPIAQFYLQGDFDVLVDYDFVSAPPGKSQLVLGVRKPGALNSTPIWEVRRVHYADGRESYETTLGGISKSVAAMATKGTLRLSRQGLTLTSYGDAGVVSTRVDADNPRVELTLAAPLEDCAGVDGGGGSCGYTPRWHAVRLGTGLLVNQP